MRPEPLFLMTPAEREAYARRMEAMAGRKRGQMPDFLRAAARVARNQWSEE